MRLSIFQTSRYFDLIPGAGRARYHQCLDPCWVPKFQNLFIHYHSIHCNIHIIFIHRGVKSYRKLSHIYVCSSLTMYIHTSIPIIIHTHCIHSLPTCLPTYLSIYLSICLSVYLSKRSICPIPSCPVLSSSPLSSPILFAYLSY